MKKSDVNSRGFTLIELLAVIVIIGILSMIAVPYISKYINQSRRKTLVTSIEEYIASAGVEVNGKKFSFRAENVIYALPIECVPLDRFGKDPYGEWHQANNKYWAYVLVQYDKENKEYIYGFTFKDSVGYALYPVTLDNFAKDGSQVSNQIYDIKQPETGVSYELIASKEDWEKSGFITNDYTTIKVLKGVKNGDGIDTCTVYHGEAEASVDIEDDEEEEQIENDYLMLVDSSSGSPKEDSMFLRTNIKRKDIEAIYTVDNRTVPNDALNSWDVSESKNGSVIAWSKDVDSNGLYEIYIGEKDGVRLNPDSTYLFYRCSELVEIDLTNLNYESTSNVNTFMGFFASCSNLEKINGIKALRTENVTSMRGMFHGCYKLKKIDDDPENVFKLHWDVSNVVNFKSFLYNCLSFKTIDFSILKDESKKPKELIDISYLIFGSDAIDDTTDVLESIIGLEYLNVENVVTMKGLFAGRTKIKEIDLSNWDTKSVEDISFMFNNCYNLTTVHGLDNFDTSDVVLMGATFQHASSIEVDISKWDFKSVRSLENFMYYASSLSTVLNLNCSNPDDLIYKLAFYGTEEITVNYTKENASLINLIDDITKGVLIEG